MIEIIPAILAKDFGDVQQKIKEVELYAQWVQLDVSDGKFTAVKTWDRPEDLKQISTSLNLEVHLMISEPEKEIEKWVSAGVKRILVHFESTERLPKIMEKVSGAGLGFGLVLSLQTPIEILDNLPVPIDKIDLVQLMGIQEIGYYGHPFDERVIPKIMALQDKYGETIKIAVDGGINVQTAKKAALAGADILVAGSAIFGKEDVGKAIEGLQESLK